MRPALAAMCILALLAACGSAESESAPPARSKPAPAPGKQASAPASAMTGPAISKDELAKAVCFFTPAEIAAKLGFTVSAGKADTKFLQDYGMASCTYPGSDNTLMITAIWIDPAQIAATRSSMTRMSGGGLIEAVPGDPDSAYLHDQQDTGSSLHYLRGNVRIQVHATSSRTPFATMKPKLLALRRVP
jgi:hypothetical protein